jgi:DNA-directed RNA polymerase specialized sigma24 family protein
MEWGFDKEFIAKDCGINVSSLDVRLNRAKKREQIEKIEQHNEE